MLCMHCCHEICTYAKFGSVVIGFSMIPLNSSLTEISGLLLVSLKLAINKISNMEKDIRTCGICLVIIYIPCHCMFRFTSGNILSRFLIEL